MNVGVIRAVILGRRLRFNNEAELQNRLEELFTAAGMTFEREWRLSAEDRPDFWFADGVALEVKFKASMSAVLRQIKRYAEHSEVKEVILVMPRPAGAPATLNGKPVHCVAIWPNML